MITDVFVSGQDGYHTYRIPSIIVTTKGTVLAFCEGRKFSRSDAGDIALIVKQSSDGGATWSESQVVWDEGANTCGNPCPVVDEGTGVVWMLMTWNFGEDTERDIVGGTSTDTRRAFVAHSTDDGLTWAEPEEITDAVKKPEWSWFATGPGVGIQLRLGQHRGRLVIPCDTKVSGDAVAYYSHAIYSDDEGKTWHVGDLTPEGTNECQVIERVDGSLLLNMRRSRSNDFPQCRPTATSKDGGATWSPLSYDETLISQRCQGSMIRYRPADASGDPVVLFSNPAHTSERVGMTVRLSGDDGRTWAASRVVFPGPSAYSCLAALPDGNVGCLFEGGEEHAYEKIMLARFGLDWLRA